VVGKSSQLIFIKQNAKTRTFAGSKELNYSLE